MCLDVVLVARCMGQWSEVFWLECGWNVDAALQCSLKMLTCRAIRCYNISTERAEHTFVARSRNAADMLEILANLQARTGNLVLSPCEPIKENVWGGEGNSSVVTIHGTNGPQWPLCSLLYSQHINTFIINF